MMLVFDIESGYPWDKTIMSENKPRGFAAMTPERRRELARKGGKRVAELGTGHKWTSEDAKMAGYIGGVRTAANRRARVAAEKQGSGPIPPTE